jgi:lipid A 3-O-deacylase
VEPFVLLIRAACLLAALAIAGQARAADPALVSLGLGATDLLNHQTRAAGDLRLEYRSDLSLLPIFEQFLTVRPWVGFETTSRQAVWGGAGILADIPLGRHFVLAPSFGVGVYGQGNGKDLGSPLEFRSAFEAGYVFDNQSRLVASFSHTSNAGFAKHNPGTEALVISYQIPIAWLLSP